MIEQLEKRLERLRQQKPLVLNLTNYVTMDFMANALLAVGAAPIMSICDAELEELMTLASALHLNIGTLDDAFIARCHLAIQIAQRQQKPIILDPVGAGASSIRTHTARTLMQQATIIRGNASEIMALGSESANTRGVESADTCAQAKEIAMALCKRYGMTIVISGPVDIVTDGDTAVSLTGGSALMPLVTGMGCALTAVIAAFSDKDFSPFENAQLATQYFGLCGQLAEQTAKTPGTFRAAFIDALYQANFTNMRDVYVQ